MAKLTNKAFLALPRARKAVLVAKDVIESIRAKRGYIMTGRYLDYWGAHNELDERPAQSCITDLQETCTVCAKGALFLSHIGRANKASVSQVLLSDEDDMRRRLVTRDRVFFAKTWDLIEVAFECWGGCGIGRVNRYEAVAFGQEHEEDDKRLVAIMLNVIRHKGEFKPSDHITASEVRVALEKR